MDKNQGVDSTLGDQPGGQDGFPEGGCGRQDTHVMGDQSPGGRYLLGPQLAMECDIERPAREAFVTQNGLDLQARQKFAHIIQTSSGKADMAGMILGTGNDAGFGVRWQSHRLVFIELGVLKGRQPEQTVTQSGRQPVLGNVDLISEDQLQRSG